MHHAPINVISAISTDADDPYSPDDDIPILHRINSTNVTQHSFTPAPDILLDDTLVDSYEPITNDPLYVTPPSNVDTQNVKTYLIKTNTAPRPPTTPAVTADITSGIRGQIDTGAALTCTNLREILHDYKMWSVPRSDIYVAV